MKRLALILVLGCSSALAAVREPPKPTWSGADAALELLQRDPAAKPAPIVAAIEAWQRESTTLAPRAAAARYVALTDELLALGMMERQEVQMRIGYEGSNFAALLPPPPSWPHIRAIWQSRAAKMGASSQDEVLGLFGDVLMGDRTAAKGKVRTVAAHVAAAGTHGGHEWAEKLLTEALQQNEELTPEALVDKVLHAPSDPFGDGERIPDLVATVGAARASALLLQLLLVPDLEIRPPAGSKTLALARQLALDKNGQLSSPHWALVQSPIESTTLFEAMEAKFVRPEEAIGPTRTTARASESSMSRTLLRAQSAYIVRLLVERRADAGTALQRALQMRRFEDKQFLGEVTSAGAAEQLADVLTKLAASDPALPIWSLYRQASLRAGRGEAAVLLMRAASKSSSRALSVAVRDELIQLELALNHVDAAVADLRQLLRDAEGDATLRVRAAAALERQISVGVALKRSDLLDDAALRVKGICSETEFGQVCDGAIAKLVGAWAEAGEGARGEALLFDRISASTKATPAMAEMGNYLRVREVAGLVSLYVSAKRYGDALKLVDGYDGWGFGDLLGAGRMPSFSHGEGDKGANLDVVVAEALLGSGRGDEARVILKNAIVTRPEHDRAYELLARLDGVALLPWLTERAEADPFEERPLIWRAQLLGESGDLIGAEAAARAAIAIDPSDGEEGRGDRLRAYSVLGEVLGRAGSADEAGRIDNVISAIRAAEDADRLRTAGLLSPAIAAYGAAAKRFEDAYCIHSRLAIELETVGRLPEARAHYERAFALMPQSFGRVESHCFGCEGVFASPSAQEISERVLTKVAKGSTHEARGRYLLGYLRKTQGRSDEAAVAFREAARLDPDYLNAWLRLLDVAEDAGLSSRERDQVALQAIRIDGGACHEGCKQLVVADLAGLWNAVAKHPRQAQPPLSTYPLRAAKAKLATNSPAQAQFEELRAGQQDGRTPGTVVASQPVVRALTTMLQRGF